MRTARFLLLMVYVAGHAGLPLPLPGGACVAGACGCGDACQCAREKVATGNCCCATKRPASSSAKSCCHQKSESCCSTAAASKSCCDNDRQPPREPVLLPCGCQQEAPEGIALCSDPRLLSRSAGPPPLPCCGWFAPADVPTAPRLVQAPDDPVPRLTA